MHPLSMAVGIVGAIVVASLAWITGVVNSHTQSSLLHSQANAAGLVLEEVTPTIRTPLATAATVAAASQGDVPDVQQYIKSDVGTKTGSLFRTLSLWRLTPDGPVRLMLLGQHDAIEEHPGAIASEFAKIPAPGQLGVIDLLGQTPSRIAYAVESAETSPRYAVFAESALPPHHRASVPSSSAFNGLNFALYLGDRPVANHLLEATTTGPMQAPLANIRIPFGTTVLDFVVSARRPLGGGVLPALPWIIGVLGAVLVAAAAVMTEWLIRRRRIAEHLARENHRLYAEQRSIAQTLQSALLPKRLPEVEGVALAARYIPGDAAADVGGDWYDVIRCDDRSFIFAVGDVSGRGVPAANTMASLHYAIRAYAAQGDGAETILQKLTALLDVGRDGHFATVLLGHVDVPEHRVTLVSAGHLPPLVVCGDDSHFIHAVPGAPIGVGQTVRYVPLTVEVQPGSSLLAYTDGLVERRGEFLDVGLDRLRDVATPQAHPQTQGQIQTQALALAPELFLDRVVSMLIGGSSDDVALLAIQWTD